MSPLRLTLLREAHDLSQRDLAALLGVTPGYIGLLETGKRHASTLMLEKLADYFRVEVAVLFTAPRREPTCQSRAS